jgi:hypothetical protein
VDLGLLNQMLPTTSKLGSCPPVSTTQFPWVFLYPSVHIEFGQPHFCWLPGFVHIILLGICFHPFAQHGLPTSVYWIILH